MNSLFLKMVGMLTGSLLLVIGYEIAFPTPSRSDGTSCQVKVESARIYPSLDRVEKNKPSGELFKNLGVIPTGKKVVVNLETRKVLMIQINWINGEVWVKRSDVKCLE